MDILYEEPDNGFVGLTWEPTLKKWILHIDCKQWSKETYKRYKQIGEEVKDMLRKRGIKEVYGLSETPKEIKFNVMFGGELLPYIVYDDKGQPNYLIRGVL